MLAGCYWCTATAGIRVTNAKLPAEHDAPLADRRGGRDVVFDCGAHGTDCELETIVKTEDGLKE